MLKIGTGASQPAWRLAKALSPYFPATFRSPAVLKGEPLVVGLVTTAVEEADWLLLQMTQIVSGLTKTGRDDGKCELESHIPGTLNVTEVWVRLGNKQLGDLVG